MRFAGAVSSAPLQSFDNLAQAGQFGLEEVRKVVGMAGVARRRVSAPDQCSSDLCVAAARKLLDQLGWARDSIDGLVFVTQTPDFFLPSTACVVHRELELADTCAAFDVGLGCSGYPYGLWIGSSLIAAGGCSRVLVLHGETPTKFTHESDRATWLLFGDAGSATALERAPGTSASFVLHSDGSGLTDLIIRGGGFRQRAAPEPRQHYLEMNGTNLFNFTMKRVPQLILDTLAQAQRTVADTDHIILHQSNRFMMQYVAKKLQVPNQRIPLTLDEFGNSGGPSVPLTLTHAMAGPRDRRQSALLIGYGVGLSWSGAFIEIEPDAPLSHIDL